MRIKWNLTPALLFLISLGSSSVSLGQTTPVPGWPVSLTPPGSPFPDDTASPPYLVNCDAGSALEVVVTTGYGIRAFTPSGVDVPGCWPTTGIPVRRIAIGDITGDGANEVLFRGQGGFWARTLGGQSVLGWPSLTSGTLSESWGLADVNGDGAQELVYASKFDQSLHCIDGSGQSLAGFPVHLEVPAQLVHDQTLVAGLAIADIDLNGTDDIVVTSRISNNGFSLQSPVWVVNGAGSLRAGWPQVPFPGSQFYTPIVADLDGDFAMEIILPGTTRVHAMTIDGLDRFSPVGTGGFRDFNACGDLDADGVLEIVVGGRDLSVIEINGNGNALQIRLATPDLSSGYPYELFRSPSIGDVDGDGFPEIAVWSLLENGGNAAVVHVFDRNLNELPGWPKSMGVTAGPWDDLWAVTLADLTGDGRAEVIYTFGDQLFAWEQTPSGATPGGVQWATVKNDERSSGFFHSGSPPQPHFTRGDANGDGLVDISDVITVLHGPGPLAQQDCRVALDANADSQITFGDALYLVGHLLLGGPALPGPFPDCEERPLGSVNCQRFECP